MGKISWNRIGLFLLITFSLSWGFHLAVAQTKGHGAYLQLGLSPLDMLFPAFAALLLQLFIYRDSGLTFPLFQSKVSWILTSYLILTAAYAGVTLIWLFTQSGETILQGAGSLLSALWVLLVIFLISSSGKEELEAAGLGLGRLDWGFKLALGVILFFLAQAGLNLILGLGNYPGTAEAILGVSIPPRIYPLGLFLGLFLSVTGTPLNGLSVVFGEEYGWRRFLLEECAPLGRQLASLLVGLITGIWHIPVILSGVHTYPPTILGFGLGMVFFTLWGYFQGYVVFKTGSIWTAAFLPGLVNSLYAFILHYLVYPQDKTFSFGLGLYIIIITVALPYLVISRDTFWKHENISSYPDVQLLHCPPSSTGNLRRIFSPGLPERS